ncbi:MAG: 16S rRNA (guanine(966)-N(2))-methyltransferase RsmD [Actinobacteria bacterium]|nr:16S rRNA (guanine(966)-N(2))-methyltransferase RsmD [Actinomycetota bacterium]
MRVVAGSARGRRLEAPAGSGTRPTSDRVREAVFNALSSLDALVDADVLDGFAGSGAMGIEALSRGARHVTFVESDRRAAQVIHHNLETCGFTNRATVVTQPLERFLASGGTGRHWHLVILDPPYAHDDWDTVTASLDADVLVIESDRAIPLTDRWDVVRDRTYGSTVVRIAERRPTPSEFQE